MVNLDGDERTPQHRSNISNMKLFAKYGKNMARTITFGIKYLYDIPYYVLRLMGSPEERNIVEWSCYVGGDHMAHSSHWRNTFGVK